MILLNFFITHLLLLQSFPLSLFLKLFQFSFFLQIISLSFSWVIVFKQHSSLLLLLILLFSLLLRLFSLLLLSLKSFFFLLLPFHPFLFLFFLFISSKHCSTCFPGRHVIVRLLIVFILHPWWCCGVILLSWCLVVIFHPWRLWIRRRLFIFHPWRLVWSWLCGIICLLIFFHPWWCDFLLSWKLTDWRWICVNCIVLCFIHHHLLLPWVLFCHLFM